MRLLEWAFLALLATAFLNLAALKNQRAGVLLPVLAGITGIASVLSEGFRSHIVPALALSGILLVCVPVKAILCLKPNRILKSAASVLLGLFLAISVALPLLFPVAGLPEASGPYPVGTTFLSFSDTARREELSPAKEHRNIPVQAWYPASDTAGEKTAGWISGKKAVNLFSEYRRLPNLFDHLALVKTHSYLNAAVSDKEAGYPVILFSGGGAMFNGQNAIQMEELASRGYIVFAVGHPYEDFACIYPDGAILPYSKKQAADLSADTAGALKIARQTVPDENDPEFARAILRNAVLSNASVRTWSGDMGFIADKLVEINNGTVPGIFAGKLDLSNMGAFGHSFGGAAAGQLCLEDSRIKAFINMDGSPFGDAPDTEIKQPFMILTHGGDEKYSIRNGYSEKEGNFIVVQIRGAKHMNFSDFNSLTPAIGRLAGFLGGIGEERQREIMNDYILSFFDKHLKEKPSPLLDAPSSKYEEVKVSVQ